MEVVSMTKCLLCGLYTHLSHLNTSHTTMSCRNWTALPIQPIISIQENTIKWLLWLRADQRKRLTSKPFSSNSSVSNIVTFIIDKKGVNIHNLEMVAENILRKTVGKRISAVSFKLRGQEKIFTDLSKNKIVKGWIIDLALF